MRETRANVITFFHNHRRWMPYDVYRAAGLPVGTGVVESACGAVVKHRMEGEGKRWSLEGAEAMLALHSLKKSHDHALRLYWRSRARQVSTRLSGRQPQYRPMTPVTRVASLDVKRSRSCAISGTRRNIRDHESKAPSAPMHWPTTSSICGAHFDRLVKWFFQQVNSYANNNFGYRMGCLLMPHKVWYFPRGQGPRYRRDFASRGALEIILRPPAHAFASSGNNNGSVST